MPSDDLRRRLIIELDGPAAEPSGWLLAGRAQRARFDGWLQLLTALEDALGRPDPPDATSHWGRGS